MLRVPRPNCVQQALLQRPTVGCTPACLPPQGKESRNTATQLLCGQYVSALPLACNFRPQEEEKESGKLQKIRNKKDLDALVQSGGDSPPGSCCAFLLAEL